MAIGLNAGGTGGDDLRRTGIPAGGAGTLSGAAFTTFFVGVWAYRPSAGNSIVLTQDTRFISCESAGSVREVTMRYDNNFGAGTYADPRLITYFNSGGGSGTPRLFPTAANFTDEWVYYFLGDNSTDTQYAGYIKLSAPTTVVSEVRTNDNAGSQYIGNLIFGNSLSPGGDGMFGWFAYARARDSAVLLADVASYANNPATVSGDWGFWTLADNTTLTDSSGNGRTLTMTGSGTSETSPSLSAGEEVDPGAGPLVLAGAGSSLQYQINMPDEL